MNNYSQNETGKNTLCLKLFNGSLDKYLQFDERVSKRF